jgi:hypothetical protein
LVKPFILPTIAASFSMPAFDSSKVALIMPQSSFENAPERNVVGVAQIVADGKPADALLSSTLASAGASTSRPVAPIFLYSSLAAGAAAAAPPWRPRRACPTRWRRRPSSCRRRW